MGFVINPLDSGNLIPIDDFSHPGYVETSDTLQGHLEGISAALLSAGAPEDAAYVTLSTDATLTNERVLTGTANQVIVTDNGAGTTVVLSTPQDLHTGASPEFAGMTLTGFSGVVQATAGVLSASTLAHSSLSGLTTGDDHTQYLFLNGRAGGQTAIGGTGSADVLTLTGSSDASLGFINVNSSIALQDLLGQSPAIVNYDHISNLVSQSTAGAGAVVQSVIRSSATITVNTGVWFTSQIADSSTYVQVATPGFSAFTLFNAFPTITRASAGSMVSSLTMQSAITHQNTSSGAVTVSANTGISYRPGLDTTVGSGTLTLTAGNALQVAPVAESVATSTVNFGTIRGVHIQEFTSTDHNGSATVTAYVGLEMDNTSFGSASTVRAAVRSALNSNTNNYFLLNNGTAQTDFGAGPVLFTGAGNIRFTRTNVLTLEVATQTVGAATATVPNLAGSSDTFVMVGLGQSPTFGTVTIDTLADFTNIAASAPIASANATSDVPTVTWGAAAGNEVSAAPAGYLEWTIGGSSRYIPFWA